MGEISADTGLDKSNWDFHISPDLGYTDADGMEYGFYYAIDLVTDLAALILESKMSGGFNFKELFNDANRGRLIRISTTPEEDQSNEPCPSGVLCQPSQLRPTRDGSSFIPKQVI
jgi:hypothetical protein